MKRLRLLLGRNQTHQMLMALSYAIDTFANDDPDETARPDPAENQMVREWQALREVVRREKYKQGVR